MKDAIILIVFCLILLLILVILTSALSDDAGFILMVWHQWQIQTSVGLALFAVVLLSLIFTVLFLLIRAIFFGSDYFYQQRKAMTRRKTLMSLDTAIRHQLVADDMGSFLAMEDSLTNDSLNLRPFNKKKGSALHLLQAENACRAGLFDAAIAHLIHIDSDDHELATLLRVKIHIGSGHFLQAKTELELLLIEPAHGLTEPTRERLQPSFDQQVSVLWSRIAAEIPWEMLAQPILPAQHYVDWHVWLNALLTHDLPERAAEEEIARLLLWMLPETQDQHAHVLFALLMRVHAHPRARLLAEQILAHRLDIHLLLNWMSVCLQDRTEDVIRSVECLLLQLEQRYPAQPDVVLARLRWLRDQRSNQPEQWQSTLERLTPFKQHAAIQHYQLIWQLEDQPDLDEHLRASLLKNLYQQYS
jgi:uncharacterized protein HemY